MTSRGLMTKRKKCTVRLTTRPSARRRTMKAWRKGREKIPWLKN